MRRPFLPHIQRIIMHPFLSGFVGIYHRVIALLALIAGVLFILMTIGIGAEAVMRSLHLGLVYGIVDFAEHSMYCIALLPAPWIMAQNGHINVNLLTSKLPVTAARAVGLLADAICLIVSLTIAIYGMDTLIQSYQRGETIIQELIIPEWWLQWQAPVVFTLLSVEFALRLIGGGKATLDAAPVRDLS